MFCHWSRQRKKRHARNIHRFCQRRIQILSSFCEWTVPPKASSVRHFHNRGLTAVLLTHCHRVQAESHCQQAEREQGRSIHTPHFHCGCTPTRRFQIWRLCNRASYCRLPTLCCRGFGEQAQVTDSTRRPFRLPRCVDRKSDQIRKPSRRWPQLGPRAHRTRLAATCQIPNAV